MRLGSVGTWTTSGTTPAALWAGRFGGPGSGAAASFAHDSSGRRSFPNTPAPAIWVVGVGTDREDLGCLSDPQALHVTTAAAASAAAATDSRIPPRSTRSTVTSAQLGPLCRNGLRTRRNQIRRFV